MGKKRVYGERMFRTNVRTRGEAIKNARAHARSLNSVAEIVSARIRIKAKGRRRIPEYEVIYIARDRKRIKRRRK